MKNEVTQSKQNTSLIRANTDGALIASWIGKQGNPRTANAYRIVAEQFMEFVGEKPLASLTVDDIVEYRNRLIAQYRPHTARSKMATIKSLLTYAAMTHYLPFNVGAAVTLPKANAALHERILTEDEVKSVIDATDNDRDRAIIVILYATGGRVSEVAGIRWGDLRTTRKDASVRVVGKGGDERYIAIPRKVYNMLMADKPEWAKSDDPIFVSAKGGPLSRYQIWRIVKAAADKAGVPNASPHWFRHANISHALDRGARQDVVQKSAGHKNANTTAGYTHINPDDGAGLHLDI